MQWGFYFDQTRCHGCHTCSVACKDWHNLEAEVDWRRVTTIEQGRFPDLFVAFLSISCLHCAEPTCIAACPVDAISKRKEDGIVVVDREKCLGKDNCDLCKQACPYEAPQFGSEDNARMQMCTFCLDRLAEDKSPICVDACPMHALDAGPLDKLKAKYGEMKETVGFAYSTKTHPAIVLKPKEREVEVAR